VCVVVSGGVVGGEGERRKREKERDKREERERCCAGEREREG